MQAPMMAIVPEEGLEQQTTYVIQERPDHHLRESVANLFFIRGWDGFLAEIELCFPGCTGMVVDAILFKCDEVGAYISLFKNTDLHAVLGRNLMGNNVNGAAVAKEEDDINVQIVQQILKKTAPFPRMAAKIDRIFTIEEPIATVEIDSVHGCTLAPKVSCKATKKRTHRSLQ